MEDQVTMDRLRDLLQGIDTIGRHEDALRTVAALSEAAQAALSMGEDA